jgi:tetratricopeptide (TPR) repeat protein
MAKSRQSTQRKQDSLAESEKKCRIADLLLKEATALLQISEAAQAFTKAKRALAILQSSSGNPVRSLPALNLLGEICIQLGDTDGARSNFEIAAQIDPDGRVSDISGGGAEKFLWLAQLCEEGGAESVRLFQKGADILRRQISELENSNCRAGKESLLEEKRTTLSNALCGIVEIYMTDLSYGIPTQMKQSVTDFTFLDGKKMLKHAVKLS